MDEKMKKIIKIVILIFVFLVIFISIIGISKILINTFGEKKKVGYLASFENEVRLYTVNEKNQYIQNNKKKRGTKVEIYEKEYSDGKEIYTKIKLDGKDYYVKKEFTTLEEEKIVKEKNIYVKTPTVLYTKLSDLAILSSVKKGEALDVIGYHKIKKDGNVEMYKVKYQKKEGYIYSTYVTKEKEKALEHYNQDGIYDLHKQRENQYGGGSASNLDYFPVSKKAIKGNKMPKEVRALYINTSAIKRIDDYISLAKKSNINAFVIDIKENTLPAYASDVMALYSPSNYKNAVNEVHDYKTYIKKALDAHFYVIGRITTFKDYYYAVDHPLNTIIDKRTGKPFSHSQSFWPSPFSRDVWQYNVALAVEAVKKMGFHEIQFDYVRFPDEIESYEEKDMIDMRNMYNEDKASAIQQFLQYAKDELHKAGAYVSVDVFGEAANGYVTSYGQYWPAISNVVDVISPMPYPDHFDKNAYGITEPVWTNPYTVLKKWAQEYANIRQKETPTPAIVRTWVQAYNSVKEPYIPYGEEKVKDQIKALYDSGLKEGYMAFNASSSLEKYTSLAPAFKKEYKNE